MQLLLTFILLLLPLTASTPERETVSSLKIPDHSLWTALLKRYVNAEGHVDYTAWQADQDLLDQYLHQLSGPLPLAHWSQNVQLSYWINIHNAYMIKLVLGNYPTPMLLDSVDDQWIQRQWIKLDTTMYSLGRIQQEIRNQFHDPRAHFALSYAARSSAPLRNEAYVPQRLHGQLDDQTTLFINDSTICQIRDSVLVLSPVFEWYASDFKPDVVTYFNSFHRDTIEGWKKIQYKPFDWTLNDQKNQ